MNSKALVYPNDLKQKEQEQKNRRKIERKENHKYQIDELYFPTYTY